MKILIDVDDSYITQYSEDINDRDYTPAVICEVDLIEVCIKPTYSDGTERYWLNVIINPDEVRKEAKFEVIEEWKRIEEING